MLCLSIYCSNLPFAQSVFQTSLLAGISIPLHSNAANGTYDGGAIHFGNSLDYLMGSGALRVGIGGYIGFLDALGTDSKYRQTAQAIAEKYALSAQGLVYHSTPFKSTHVLLGPVAAVKAAGLDIDLWAKGGYGINQPGEYAVVYQGGNLPNNIFVNQSGENRNGLAYSLGGGIRYGVGSGVCLQLAADYFNTKTDLVNYNFDREKGTRPLFITASNAYLQASAGVVFTIGGVEERGPGNKVVRNKRDRAGKVGVNSNGVKPDGGKEVLVRQEAADKNNPGGDTLYFSPEKLVIKGPRQTQGASFGDRSGQSLSSVNNYLTGFVYRNSNGPVIAQCGPSAMAGEPIPGIDVKMLREGGSSPLLGRTNTDGSFAINNIPPGNYRAVLGGDTVAVGIRDYGGNPGFSILQLPVNECTLANNVVYSENKLYVEVIAAREASSGMASGRRMVALASGPLAVTHTDFEVNWKNIISNDGKLYAEVTTSREAGSGMATGRRMVVTGDVDGDGIAEYSVQTAREHGTGLATGKRLAPRDVASGQASGLVLNQRVVATGRADGFVVTPRDPATGQSSGRIVLLEADIDEEDGSDDMADRDAATGMASGKRMHKPFSFQYEGDTYVVHLHKEKIIHRDLAARSGMAPGGGSGSGGGLASDPSNDVVNNPLYEGNGSQGVNPMHTGSNRVAGSNGGNVPLHADGSNALADNPLYEGRGTSGENPLFEGKSDLRVVGSNGTEHSLSLPAFVDLKTVITTSPNPGSSFECLPSASTAGGQKAGNGNHLLRASINTTRSNIKHQSRIACMDGSCSVECVVEVNGAEYDAVMTGRFRKAGV
jgi:hypothetical protein